MSIKPSRGEIRGQPAGPPRPGGPAALLLGRYLAGDISAEVAVAALLASVGDVAAARAAVLARATAEVVELFDRSGLLADDRTALEIGCGIGRVQAALGRRLRAAWGVDLSLSMLAAARRRTDSGARLGFALTAGRDLAFLRSGRFDVVYAVDSFPYLQSGGRGARRGAPRRGGAGPEARRGPRDPQLLLPRRP